MYVISCESTIDLPREYVEARNCPTIKYSYFDGDVEHVDDMNASDEHMEEFYAMLKTSKPTTSLICSEKYVEYFESFLAEGKDVLHIAFGSGMSQSVHNACVARDQLLEKYPYRKLEVIDSTCSSAGYGLLVDDALDMRDEGASFDEIANFAKNNCHKLHHQFFSTDLSYFRKSGRVSGTAAFIGSILGICPSMRLNYDGKIIAYSNSLGKKKALKYCLSEVSKHIEKGQNYDKKMFICHSNCVDTALTLKEELQKAYPKAKDMRIVNIGPIIACHCGPGTVAVFFWGDERPQ